MRKQVFRSNIRNLGDRFVDFLDSRLNIGKHNKFYAWFACLVLTSALSLSAYAQKNGGGNGGGGDVVVLPDLSVVLADPFLNQSASQPNNMPPMRKINPEILQLVESFRRIIEPNLLLLANHSCDRSDINDELKNLVKKDNGFHFYTVQTAQEMGMYCGSGGDKIYTLPVGAKSERVACTTGNKTFIIEPYFAQLSIKDRALLLIHERLTTLEDNETNRNFNAVAKITTGLSVFVSLYKEQSTGIKRVLTDPEVKQLKDFYVGIEELELRNSTINEHSFDWTTHPFGGAQVHNSASVSTDAFVGVDTILGRGSFVDSGASITKSNFKVKCGCEVPPIKVGKNVILDSFRFIGSELVVGANSRFKNSTISNFAVPNVGIRDDDQKLSTVAGSCVQREVKISENQVLENGTINDQSVRYLIDSYKAQPISLEGNLEQFTFDNTGGYENHIHSGNSYDQLLPTSQDQMEGVSARLSMYTRYTGLPLFHGSEMIASDLAFTISANPSWYKESELYTISDDGRIGKALYKKFFDLIFRSGTKSFFIPLKSGLERKLQASGLKYNTFVQGDAHESRVIKNFIRIYYPTKDE